MKYYTIPNNYIVIPFLIKHNLITTVITQNYLYYDFFSYLNFENVEWSLNHENCI
jgi:hypothetical protein